MHFSNLFNVNCMMPNALSIVNFCVHIFCSSFFAVFLARISAAEISMQIFSSRRSFSANVFFEDFSPEVSLQMFSSQIFLQKFLCKYFPRRFFSPEVSLQMFSSAVFSPEVSLQNIAKFVL